MTTLAQLLAPFNDTTKVLVCDADYNLVDPERTTAKDWKWSNTPVEHCFINGAGNLVIVCR